MLKHTYCTAFHMVMEEMAGKWKSSIIFALGTGPTHSNALRKFLIEVNRKDISKKVFYEQINGLIDDRLVEKFDLGTINKPQVIYCLTENGYILRDLMTQIAQVGENVTNSKRNLDAEINYRITAEQLRNLYHSKKVIKVNDKVVSIHKGDTKVTIKDSVNQLIKDEVLKKMIVN